MSADADGRLRGRSGTDIGAMQDVMAAVDRLIRQKWRGWPLERRQDLASIVLEKYVAKFGRENLPVDQNGERSVPASWLRVVIANAGVDLHRREQARPVDARDFGDDPALENRLWDVLQGGAPSLASAAIHRLDIADALARLGAEHPVHADLIRWSLLEDLALTEVAERAGKSPAATKKALQRAVARLRELMTEPGPTP